MTVCCELTAYGHGLDEKKELVALNKIDAMSENEIEEKSQSLLKAGARDVMLMSNVSNTGVEQVLRGLRPFVDANRDARDSASGEKKAWAP